MSPGSESRRYCTLVQSGNESQHSHISLTMSASPISSGLRSLQPYTIDLHPEHSLTLCLNPLRQTLHSVIMLPFGRMRPQPLQALVLDVLPMCDLPL